MFNLLCIAENFKVDFLPRGDFSDLMKGTPVTPYVGTTIPSIPSLCSFYFLLLAFSPGVHSLLTVKIISNKWATFYMRAKFLSSIVIYFGCSIVSKGNKYCLASMSSYELSCWILICLSYWILCICVSSNLINLVCKLNCLVVFESLNLNIMECSRWVK